MFFFSRLKDTFFKMNAKRGFIKGGPVFKFQDECKEDFFFQDNRGLFPRCMQKDDFFKIKGDFFQNESKKGDYFQDKKDFFQDKKGLFSR